MEAALNEMAKIYEETQYQGVEPFDLSAETLEALKNELDVSKPYIKEDFASEERYQIATKAFNKKEMEIYELDDAKEERDRKFDDAIANLEMKQEVAEDEYKVKKAKLQKELEPLRFNMQYATAGLRNRKDRLVREFIDEQNVFNKRPKSEYI